MNPEYFLQAAVLVVLIILSGFFSSAETAMTTVSRIRVQSLMEQGNRRAVILDKIISDQGRMLSTILIGNNIVNISASALMTSLVIDVFGSRFIGAATGVLTLIVLLFGEITPKTLAAIRAEKVSLSYAPVIYALIIVLTPVVYIVGRLEDGIMFLLRVDTGTNKNVLTERELRTLVNVSEKNGVIENEEKKMIYNVFDFGDSKAKDVMIPRIDMTFIDINATYEELIEVFREDRHTRFPVYEENTDNIKGIINVKDLILLPTDGEFSVRKILREPYFTYEYKGTADLLVEMRKASVSLAIVLDEYGSTAGLVTLEDLLEEIVGEIRDEYDVDEEESIVEVKEGREYIASGSARLDDINEKLGTDLVSEDYDSIGGYIIGQLDSLPYQGQSVVLPDGIRLVTDEVHNNRIESVHIWLPEEADPVQEE